MKQHFAFACALLLSATLSAQWVFQKAADYNTLWVDMVDANTVWASLEQNADGGVYTPGIYWLKAMAGNKVLTEKFFTN